MSTDPEHDDLAQDLHAMRAEPRPEFARELDHRAAGWLRERPKRRLPSLRIAIPAVATAAAAAVVVAIVVSGGDDGAGGGGDGGGGSDQLEVAVVSEGSPQSGFGAPQPAAPGTVAPEDSLGAPLERDVPQATGGAFFLPTTQDGTVTLRYVFGAPTEATVELAGRQAEVTLEPGPGSLEISTEGLPPGTHDLTITTPAAPVYRERIQISR